MNHKQENMTQMAQQSHRHERQDESTESGHLPCGPHSDSCWARSLLWIQTLWCRHFLPKSLQPWGWEQLLTSIILALPHSPQFFPFGSFISYVTDLLHGTPSPMSWVLFSWVIHTDPRGCAQRTREPGGTFQSLVKGVLGARYFETSWDQSLFFLFVWTS